MRVLIIQHADSELKKLNEKVSSLRTCHIRRRHGFREFFKRTLMMGHKTLRYDYEMDSCLLNIIGAPLLLPPILTPMMMVRW